MSLVAPFFENNFYTERFHSRGQQLCKFIETKESVCIRKEFNSQRIGLGHQHGRRFIVLGHQYGRRDVMWKHSIEHRVFSLKWPASMQIYWNKRKRLHKKRVQLPQDWFGTPTWPPFHCFGTPIWRPWRHVKTLYAVVGNFLLPRDHRDQTARVKWTSDVF